jgi:hypothetical protein
MQIVQNSAKYIRADNTAIDCRIVIGGKEHPFTAVEGDASTASAWTALQNGDAGQIAAYVEPTPDLETLRAAKLAGIDAKIDALFAAGAPVTVGENTLHVALSDGSRADLTAMATTAVAASTGAVPWPESYQTGWIAVENVRIPLDAPATGLGLAAGVGDYYAQIRQHGRDLKDAALAAEDQAALDAVDIEAGWPG